MDVTETPSHPPPTSPPSFVADQRVLEQIAAYRSSPSRGLGTQRNKRIELLLLIFTVGSLAFVLVGVTVRVDHPFDFTFGPGGSLNADFSCSVGPTFSWSGQVSFRWTSAYMGYGGSSFFPDFELRGPSGPIVSNGGALNGSYAFDATGGSYQFFDSECMSAYYVHIVGQGQAPWL